MSVIFQIAKRDLMSFIFSPLFFLLAAICTMVWSFSFIKKTIDFSYNSMSPQGMSDQVFSFFEIVVVNHISVINLILIFAIAAITMKLFAEERKTRTIDLLLTSPITSFQIIMGKYIAGFCIAILLVLMGYLYPAMSLFFVKMDVGLLMSSFLGLVLLASTYVAIGLFASTFSGSLVLSMVMAVSINLFLWILSEGTIYSESTWMVKVLDHLSVGENLFTMVRGSISLSAMVYFLSLTLLFVFLSQKVIDSIRWR